MHGLKISAPTLELQLAGAGGSCCIAAVKRWPYYVLLTRVRRAMHGVRSGCAALEL